MSDPCVVKARRRFLGFHHALRRRVGKDYRAYKLLEIEKLDDVFESLLASRKRGVDFVGEMIHRLTWAQALPNLNHRTTLGFVQAFLEQDGTPVPWTAKYRYKSSVEAWMKESKNLLLESEMWDEQTRPWKNLARKQRRATLRWLGSETQSGSLTKASPQRLRNFLSCSVRTPRTSRTSGS